MLFKGKLPGQDKGINDRNQQINSTFRYYIQKELKREKREKEKFNYLKIYPQVVHKIKHMIKYKSNNTSDKHVKIII